MLCFESFASGQPIISANATCTDGTAAYGLTSAVSAPLACETCTPVRSETVSMKPYSGMNRGGAVGKTM